MREVSAAPQEFVAPEGTAPLTSGTEAYCRALVAYFNKEMTVAEVAKFQVVPGARFYGGTHTIVLNKEVANRYSVTMSRLREAAHDFLAGFNAR